MLPIPTEPRQSKATYRRRGRSKFNGPQFRQELRKRYLSVDRYSYLSGRSAGTTEKALKSKSRLPLWHERWLELYDEWAALKKKAVGVKLAVKFVRAAPDGHPVARVADESGLPDLWVFQLCAAKQRKWGKK